MVLVQPSMLPLLLPLLLPICCWRCGGGVCFGFVDHWCCTENYCVGKNRCSVEEELRLCELATVQI